MKAKPIKNRIELAEYFAELGFTRGAEIGVADGRYSEILLQKIPNLTLYSIDPWASYDGNWRSDEYQKQAYSKAVDRLSKYSGSNIVKATSLDAYTSPEYGIPEKLDFVFIDGAHDFDNVMLDLLLWSERVKIGGIVSGHDYYNFHNSGIIQAVYTYTQAHYLDYYLTLPNFEGSHKDDKCPCWWFIKE